MKKVFSVLSAIAVMFLFTSYSAHAGETPEANHPTLKTGFTFEATTTSGKQETTTLVSQNDETYQWNRNDGECKWSTMKSDYTFAPVVEWDCKGRTGSRSITRHGDVTFPLTFGKQWSYTWGSRERTCEVSSAYAQVETGMGAHNTFEVVCNEGSKGARTYYIDSALGGIKVKFVKVRGSKTSGWTLKKVLSNGS